jgi:hypothetical protein
VKLRVSCDKPCTVEVKGTVRAGRSPGSGPKGLKAMKLKRVRVELAAGQSKRVKLGPSKRLKRKLQSATRATATIRGTAADGLGNEDRAKARVRLR